MKISLVVAMARNRVIGRDGAMPWRLPEDLAYFKRVTMGHPIVMGRKTYESIGRPLPGRLNIVVTRNAGFAAPGCRVVDSMEAAYGAAGDAHEVSVIGGTSIFDAALPRADVIHLTEVDAEVAGDTWFPAFDRREWDEHEVLRHPADARHEHPFRIVRLERRRATR
jgi:dihydrofolate reductase